MVGNGRKIAESEHSISKSPDFLENIKYTNIVPEECIVSFYVVTLFTCKPLGFALKITVNHLD